MQAYQSGLEPSDTRLVLSPDSEFLRYFTDPDGAVAAPAGPRQTAPAPAQ
jgi:membrane protease subunit HflC